MTLKEREKIVQALECCLADRVICDNCPIQKECESNPFDATLARYAFALIKDLTEENKDLEAEYDRVYEQAEADIRGNMADGGTSCHWCENTIKARAIKEFVEAYKEHIKSCTGMFTDDGFYVPLDAVLRIVEFRKEQMIGEQE